MEHFRFEKSNCCDVEILTKRLVTVHTEGSYPQPNNGIMMKTQNDVRCNLLHSGIVPSNINGGDKTNDFCWMSTNNNQTKCPTVSFPQPRQVQIDYVPSDHSGKEPYQPQTTDQGTGYTTESMKGDLVALE